LCTEKIRKDVIHETVQDGRHVRVRNWLPCIRMRWNNFPAACQLSVADACFVALCFISPILCLKQMGRPQVQSLKVLIATCIWRHQLAYSSCHEARNKQLSDVVFWDNLVSIEEYTNDSRSNIL
jgi:hypothetical protein